MSDASGAAMPSGGIPETAGIANPPAIILIEPQLGDNIGKAARAMLNCGLVDLRLVRPRDGWPNERATANASGADIVIDNAKVFERDEDAIADLNRVYVTTARTRDAIKPVFTPRGLAPELRTVVGKGEKVGVLFGPERTGVRNEHIAMADAVVTVPLNPGFTSLNLAQAVLLIGYEWWQAGVEVPDYQLMMADTFPATKQDMERLFEHLEHELDESGFFRVAEKRPGMARNIRNIFNRSNLTHQEVQTLRGMIVAMRGGKHKPES
ncbi:RNA methyltransferase [Thalassospira lucentensis]|uniref:RNA methyltransferase n=1 Tax=Thalassospira lucentensis TaxID=168935 RepID=UPI00142E203F|nr:RNA methyltransferase [Thalassospira lucentensis]NIZ01441.1 RNA methyltransferase [Thalassospira lucentensis]